LCCLHEVEGGGLRRAGWREERPAARRIAAPGRRLASKRGGWRRRPHVGLAWRRRRIADIGESVPILYLVCLVQIKMNY
jgi:hypothetical protein